MVYIDMLTVLVSSLVFLVIGCLWYSRLVFGRIWERYGCNKFLETKRKWLAFLLSFLFAFILAYFLALIEGYLDVTSFWDGVIAGFLIWVGFILPANVFFVIWERKSFFLFLLDMGYWLIGLMIMGGILAG